MTLVNKEQVNFVGGEAAPGLTSRTDIPLYTKALSFMQNFLCDPKGPAIFRPGTRYVHHTRLNRYARFIEFQFNDSQSYLIEATDLKFRFYKDEGIILNSTTKTITGITKANPAVVTSASHGYTNGQEVYITGVVGMTEVNDRFFIVAGAAANTFQLTDVNGNNINSTSYTTYSSGGTAANIYEIDTPYTAADIDDLMYDQNADTMYIVHRNYEPRKLNRTAHDAWQLITYTRTNDPFTSGAKAITGVTRSNPGRIQVPSHGFTTGTLIAITGVVGTTELNGNTYQVGSVLGPNDFYLNTSAGAPIDMTGYTAYVSGGTATTAIGNVWPAAVAFTSDGCLMFAGSSVNPETFWKSRAPLSGVKRFDDFTTGTLDTDAVTFTLAPLRGRVDAVRWIANTDKFIVLGTYGSVRRLFGETESASVTPTAVTAKSANSDGVARTRPILDGPVAMYISRSGITVEALEFDYKIDGYAPDDKTLIIDHLMVGGLKALSRQAGRLNLNWAVRRDGVLLGLTYQRNENIAGWHRHVMGGSGAVEAIGIMPRDNAQNQLWLIVKRTIGGVTVRHVEFMEDLPEYPDRINTYVYGPPYEALDDVLFANYQGEVLKSALHLDDALSYDGFGITRSANVTLTPGAGATNNGQTNVTFTASGAIFTSAMVGRELWAAYKADGSRGGKAVITGYTNSTTVTCTISRYFENLTAIPAGEWAITASGVSGLYHLEGQSVYAVADGIDKGAKTVSSAAISIGEQRSIIHVGFRPVGIIRTMPLEQGGVSGPAHNKRRNVEKVAMRFINSQKTKYGTSLYKLSEIQVAQAGSLYTGVAEQVYPEDKWDDEKVLYIYHANGLPCTVQCLDVYSQVTDEE